MKEKEPVKPKYNISHREWGNDENKMLVIACGEKELGLDSPELDYLIAIKFIEKVLEKNE